MQWRESLKSAEFFLVLGLMILVIFVCLSAKQITMHPGDTSILAMLADTFIVALRIDQSDVSTTILHACNISTLLYAGYFYLVRSRTLGAGFILIVLGFFVVISFLSFGMSYQLSKESPFGLENITRSDSAKLYLISEYGYSVAMTSFFWIADFYKSTKVSEPEEKALLKFSSMYLSAPALMALLASAVLYIGYVDPGLTIAASTVAHSDPAMIVSPTVAYLAGTGAVVLFLTNLILAMSAAPWYASRLRLTIA